MPKLRTGRGHLFVGTGGGQCEVCGQYGKDCKGSKINWNAERVAAEQRVAYADKLLKQARELGATGALQPKPVVGSDPDIEASLDEAVRLLTWVCGDTALRQSIRAAAIVWRAFEINTKALARVVADLESLQPANPSLPDAKAALVTATKLLDDKGGDPWLNHTPTT